MHTEEEQFKVLLSTAKNTLGLAGVIIGGCFGLVNLLIALIVASLKCQKGRRGKNHTTVDTIKIITDGRDDTEEIERL